MDEVAMDSDKIMVIPCSGIGKVHGLLSREATYLVVDELAPKEIDTLCLALLVKGDPEAVDDVRSSRCITVDGCAKACAQKNVSMAGGKVDKTITVASFLSNYRGSQPGNGSALTEEGWAIARDIAQAVVLEAASLRDDGGER
jgi:uncharacterized metal-binding protein